MPPMRVLVTYGSRRGGTAEIAGWVGDELRRHGLAVDVVPADRVRRVDRYQAVVLGGALYGARWHPAARRVARRHRSQLRRRPVWLFSSGPTDPVSSRHDLPPLPSVARLADRVGARSHRTFGGVIPLGVGVAACADFRDPVEVRAWAAGIASAMGARPTASSPPAARGPAPARPPARSYCTASATSSAPARRG